MNFFKMTAVFFGRIYIAIISAVNKMLQHRAAGSVFRAAGAVIFTAMAIGLFPAAGEMMELNDDDGYVVGAADAHEDVSVDIIYRDNPGSEWSFDAARELAGELYDRYGYAARLIPATDALSAIIADDYIDGVSSGGAIVIGHTDLSETDYSDAYYSIGADGFRTYFNSRGDLIIEAFGSAGAAAGIDRFLSNYNGDSTSAVFIDDNGKGTADINAVLAGYSNFCMEVEEADGGSITVTKNSLGEKSNVRALVLAAPDSSAHSIAAIEALLDDAEPDMVIFTGELSAGAGDRAELKEAWAAIAAPLCARGIAWSFIGADEDVSNNDSDSLPAVMQNEVVAATDGCIGCGNGSLIEIGMGDAAGGICLIGDSGEDALIAAEKLIEDSELSDATLCVITAGDVETAIDEDNEAAETLTRLAASGVRCIVDCDGTGDTDITQGDTVLASAGSIGYDSPGLGGRFAYNNSLRGGVLLTFARDEANGIALAVEYILAADLVKQ